jgi:hypothetical protein
MLPAYKLTDDIRTAIWSETVKGVPHDFTHGCHHIRSKSFPEKAGCNQQ